MELQYVHLLGYNSEYGPGDDDASKEV